MNHLCAKPTLLITLSGAEGFTTEEDQEMLSRIEKQLKKRFAIGSQVSEHAIVQDFLRQVIWFYINRLMIRFQELLPYYILLWCLYVMN